jgi:transglutaminase-like putative cysteine protease
MEPSLTLRIALYLLVLDGLVALYLGDFVGPAGLGGLVLALAASWAWRHWRPGAEIPPALDRALVTAVAAGFVADLLWLAETWVDAPPRLLIFLVVYKLFTLRTVRDSRTVAFLAFFMLAFASASAFGVGFLFVFVAFVLLSTWLLVLQQVELEAAPAAGRVTVGPPVTPVRLFALALTAWLAATAITAVLFFAIPRIGLAALPLRAKLGRMITGFSDRVELGAYGPIEIDDTVVMRVYVSEWTDHPERLTALRWRGLALDQFDGRAWTVRRDERETVWRTRNGDFALGVPQGTGRILVQEVFREAIGTDVLFAAPRALRLRLRTGAIQVDSMGSLAAPAAASQLHYAVESELEGDQPPDARVRNAPVSLGDPGLARYLQLPPLAPRVRDLARRLTAESRDAYEAAVQLSAHLSREYRYSLVRERRTSLDPVEEFLFVSRTGNCEYFAAALAVMLRSLGIPARVINGFQRGDWNPYGRYFMVRFRDAHSWVEAYVGGPGWMTLDPSPRGEVPPELASGPMSLYLDSLRMRWHRYVINWSFRDQVQAAVAIRRQTQAWRPALGWFGQWRGLSTAALVVGLGVVLVRVWRRAGGPARRRAAARLPGFYARALRRARRLGLRPEAGETAREFAVRVGRAAPGWTGPFAEITGAYEACRFGGVALSPAEVAALEGRVARLTGP